MNINVVSPSEDVYAKNPNFVRIASEKLTEDPPIIYKRTYLDPSCLIAKIGQVALAALLTLVTLGLILISEKGRSFWSDAIDRFKHPVVYIKMGKENTSEQPLKKPVQPTVISKSKVNPAVISSQKPIKPTAISKPNVTPPPQSKKPMQPSKPIPMPVVNPNPPITQPPKPTFTAAEKALKEKYKEIFAKYVIASHGNLLLKENNVDTGLTETSLLRVIDAVDKIAESKEVKTTGKVIRVDNQQYIVKVDEPSTLNSDKKLHIILSSSSVALKRGRQGILKKVLHVSNAMFAVLKYINVEAPDAVEDRDFILNEIEMLNFIHEKGDYSGFQHPPVTTLNIHDLKENASYLGYVSPFYDKGDLSTQLDILSFKDRYELATNLINHATELWNRHVWHTDYKLENIFVEEVSVSKTPGSKKKPAIRIGDFGFAGKLKNRDKNKKLLIAPGSNYSQADVDAILKIEKEANPKDEDVKNLVGKKEVMGIGLSIYFLLAKTFGQDRIVANGQLAAWQKPFSADPLIKAGCTQPVADLILSMAQLDPKDRPSMEEIKPLWEALH